MNPDLDLAFARAAEQDARRARESANRQRRKDAAQEEERNPKLPKACGCDQPMRIHDDPLLGPRCLRCGRSTP